MRSPALTSAGLAARLWLQGIALLAAVGGALPARFELGLPDRDLRPGDLDGRPLLVPLPRHRPAAPVLDLPGHHARDRARGEVHDRSASSPGSSSPSSSPLPCGRSCGRDTRGSPPRSRSLIWAPNLAWQVAKGFPSLVYITNHQGAAGGPVTYLIQFVVYFFFLLPLWGAGMVSLFRSRSLRPIGIACAVPLVLFLFVGKSYYAAGTIPIALAQGLMALSRIERPKLRSAPPDRCRRCRPCSQFAVFFFLVVPVTPPDRIHATRLDTDQRGVRRQRGMGRHREAGDDDLRRPPRLGAGQHGHHLGLLRRARAPWMSMTAPAHAPGGGQSAAERLVLAAEQPHGDLRADGGLPARPTWRGCARHRRSSRTSPCRTACMGWSKALRSRCVSSRLQSRRSGDGFATSLERLASEQWQHDAHRRAGWSFADRRGLDTSDCRPGQSEKLAKIGAARRGAGRLSPAVTAPWASPSPCGPCATATALYVRSVKGRDGQWYREHPGDA